MTAEGARGSGEDRRRAIERKLRAGLDASFIEVIDESHLHAGHAGARSGGGHFRTTIVSDRFDGLSSVAAQRLVYALLADEMGGEIHALSMKTFTPAEWGEELTPAMAQSDWPTDPDAFRAQVRAWLAANRPPVPDFVLPQNPLEITTGAQFVYLRDWQHALYTAGLVGLEWPVEYGGRGLPVGLQRIANQEMTRAGVPFLVNIVGLSWAGPIIRRFGTEAQKRRYLPKLLSAEEVWCQGFSEPGAGSDLASLSATARRDGDSYVIDGHKVWTSQAQFAAHCILLARTDPSAAKHAGISYFLAPMDVPGIEVQPLLKMTGEGGFNQVIFTAARIPADTLLGREGQGWELATATLSFERGASEGSAGAGGGADLSVHAVVLMARGLRRDGRPVLDDPVVRDRLAAFAIEETANRISQKRARIAGLVADRPLALPLISKLTGSELGQRLSDYACELQGWAGALYVGDENAVAGAEWQRAYMNSYAMTIAGGTSEVVRNVVGEKVLGLPKTR